MRIFRTIPIPLVIFVAAALTSCSAASTPQVPSSTPPPSFTPSQTATLAPPTPTPTPTLVNWTLVWSDEFDLKDGSSVNQDTWMPAKGGGGWGNGELEYYTDRIENVFIDNPEGKNGVLVIQARREDYQRYKFTSARLNTRNSFQFTYGRVEARIRIPFGQGIWPAFWMLSGIGGWPGGGEIDIMENIGKEPDLVHGTIHGPGYAGAQSVGAPYRLPGGEPFNTDFHLYAVEWEPNEIRWFVDHQHFLTLTPDDLPSRTKWVFDHPFYLLINVAVGGGWPGFPDETTTFPQEMLVDYVRVYARPGGWPTSTPTPSRTPKD